MVSWLQDSQMPAMPALVKPWNTAVFSATAMRCAASSRLSKSTSRAPRSPSRSSARETVKSARSSISGSTRRWMAATSATGPAVVGSVRPRFVAE